jgi:prevent-host-death family protein
LVINIAVFCRIFKGNYKIEEFCHERAIYDDKAKNKLPEIVHAVEDGPAVQLTRHGRPVAVLLSARAYEQLNRKKEGFWRSFKAFQKVAEREDVLITDQDFAELR